MRTWLVTGGAGFIGSSFARLALARHLDLRLVVLDKLTYAGNRDNLAGLDPARLDLVLGDICDAGAVEKAMRGAEAVVHFAAETHVDRSLIDAGSFVQTDVAGTWVLVEAARKLGLTRFVHVSTDEVYGSRAEGFFREEDACAPRNPYAASKLGGERMAYAYFATHGVPVVIVRPSNNYGPHQHVEKFVPLFITNALGDRPLPLYGDGMNVRDWLYVEDCARALLLLAERGVPGEVYNLPGGNERANREVAERILDLLGKPRSLLQPVKDRVGHDRRYAVDGSKLHALGFKPEVGFEAGLARTVAWYREHPEWWRKLRGEEFERYYDRQYTKR
jgi:dTDP-glucose 4,6-dehydratase